MQIEAEENVELEKCSARLRGGSDLDEEQQRLLANGNDLRRNSEEDEDQPVEFGIGV